jgi:hypothetical protein
MNNWQRYTTTRQGYRVIGPEWGATEKPEKPQKFHDFSFPDGYVFRQYRDGSIYFVESPKGGKGITITAKSHPKEWKSITDAIASIKAGKRADAIRLGTGLVLAILATLTPVEKTRMRHRRAAPPPVEPPPPVVQAPAIPWVPMGIAVLIGAVVLKLARR